MNLELLLSVGLIAVGSFLLATFLMVVDELFTLNLYHRTDWSKGWDPSTFGVYPYPWRLGSGKGYTPWKFAFGMIIASVTLLTLGCMILGKLL